MENHVYQSIRICTDEWLVRYQDQLAKYKEVPSEYHSDYSDELIADAAEAAGRIHAMVAQGQAPSAYSAAYQAALASELSRALWVDDKRGRDQARLYVARFAQTNSKIKNAVQKLKKFRPKNLGQLGKLIYSYSSLTQSICQHEIGQQMVSGELKMPTYLEDADEDEKELERLLEAVEFLQSSAYDCQILDDMLEMGVGMEGKPLPEDMPIEATSDFFRRASQANLNQFEKSVIDSSADSQHVTFELAQRAMLCKDIDYLLVWWEANKAQRQMLLMFDETTIEYARLGIAISSYSYSYLLMAKYYSLGVIYDEDEVITGVRREAALDYMLDFSEDQARRNIQFLTSNGVDASDVIFSQMGASRLASGDTCDRLMALQYLWEGNIGARTLAYLGGFADVGTPPNSAAP
ncbi:hypothetical protein Pla123a_42620 [Posidoniimonas polymericola]|uniref:Uncharacterized protein n=1 Tax=Posidoniimonas polymericola TaxID=2528002 RepID=A0A5C5XWI8_9BACT|nr:hypothetical protein [Posidoniimonas polymericola]TWT67706.1 hypothetical protein Pla123a_42620 [Posidoniimonas polymericola]